jgi:hypothetical protein
VTFCDTIASSKINKKLGHGPRVQDQVEAALRTATVTEVT